MSRNRRTAFAVLAATAAAAVAGRAQGQTLTLEQGPAAYNATTGNGYRSPSVPTRPGMTAGTGVGVGRASVYSGATFTGVTYAYEITSAGVTQLQPAGTSSTGQSSSTPYAVNAAGVIVGSSSTYNGGGSGPAPVVWNASGGVTVLQNLGTDANGNSYGYDYAVNQYGVSAGQQTAYNASGTSTGTYAVRWDASGKITALAPQSTSGTGSSYAQAYGINSSGTVVGTATAFTGVGGASLGSRPVLWAGGGSAVTTLGILGTTTTGSTSGTAYAVNDAGTSVGTVTAYTAGGSSLGAAATRWDASGNVTQLNPLGTSSTGTSSSTAYALNTAGTTIGYSTQYNSSGTSIGNRATAWAAGSTTAVELTNLGLSTTGSTTTNAYGINDNGLIVGNALVFNSSNPSGVAHATLWLSNGTGLYTPTDLNALLSPADANNFVLNTAYSISNTDWVTALATYLPTGNQEEVLFNVSALDATAAPEPTSLVLLASAAAALLLARRSRRRRLG